MAPIADGFKILVAAAAFLGALVGTIGGTLFSRLRLNLVLGGVLTVCAYVLLEIALRPGDYTWLRAKLIWGVPSLSVTYLTSSVLARWLAARTTLRPIWADLAALGLTLCVGYLYLFLFRFDMRAPLRVALGVDPCLILLLLTMRSRWKLTQP